MKLSLLALALLSFSCAHQAGLPDQPGQYVETTEENGLARTWVLKIPKGYDGETALPLVILFHGWTGSAKAIEATTGFGEKADAEDFVLAIPDGTEGIGSARGWNCSFLDLGNPKADDVKFTTDILNQIEGGIKVDPKRVYVAGHSNGAMMAYDIGAKLSDRIAAIAVVSGTIGVPGSQVSEPTAPVSAIIFHGKEDETVPYDASHDGLIKATPAPESAKWWADRDGCEAPAETKASDEVIEDYKGGRNGAEVEFVTILDGRHAWPGGLRGKPSIDATSMIWDFFKAHPKG